MREKNNRLLKAIKEIRDVIKAFQERGWDKNIPLTPEQWDVIEFLMEWGDLFYRERDRVYIPPAEDETNDCISLLFFELGYARTVPALGHEFRRKHWYDLFDSLGNHPTFGDRQNLQNIPQRLVRLFWLGFARGNASPVMFRAVAAGEQPHFMTLVGANRVLCYKYCTRNGRCTILVQCTECGRFVRTCDTETLIISATENCLSQEDRRQVAFISSGTEMFGRIVCDDCTSEILGAQSLYRCADCGVLSPQHYHQVSPFTNHGYCPHHWGRRYGDETPESIRARQSAQTELQLYRKRRPLVFYGDGDGNKFFGVETEIENIGSTDEKKEDFCQKVENRWANMFNFKYDGSLYNGLEFNTMPATLEYLMANEQSVKSVLQYAQRRGTSGPTSRCGLHIHVDSRAFLDDLHIHNFQLFFDGNHSFCRLISERSEGSLREWAELRDVPYENTYLEDWCDDVQDNDDDRYRAVNYCALRAKGTLEVRLFKGTLFPHKWLGRVQIVRAVLDVTRREKKHVVVSPFDVADYLSKNNMSYGYNIASAAICSENY